jgi:hypothetical protein
VFEEMLNQRLKSEANNSQLPKKDELPFLMQRLDMIPSQAPTVTTTSKIQTINSDSQESLDEYLDPEENFEIETRDAGVSDKIWAQVQLNKQAAENAARLSLAANRTIRAICQSCRAAARGIAESRGSQQSADR